MVCLNLENYNRLRSGGECMEEYDIELSVPLGIRKGTMLFKQENEMIEGKMTILGNTTCFHGRVSLHGFIIEGTLKTSLRMIYFKGHGKLLDDRIEIDLIDGKKIYKIKGRKI